MQHKIILFFLCLVFLSCSKKEDFFVHSDEFKYNFLDDNYLKISEKDESTRVKVVKASMETKLVNNLNEEKISAEDSKNREDLLESLIFNVANKDLIVKNQEEFFHFMKIVMQKDEENNILAIADKTHSIGKYRPTDLVSLDDYSFSLNKKNMLLRRVLIKDLSQMIKDARKDGVELPISSAFRSYNYQVALFNRYVKRDGVELANTYSSKPGYSEHQLGLTMDFGSVTESFKNSKAGKWLAKNSLNYGFGMSYPEGLEDLTGYVYEPWHFRYLSKEGGLIVKKYFFGISHDFLSFVEINKKNLLKL